MPHHVAFVHFNLRQTFNVCFGLIKHLQFTISEVSNIMGPLDQTYTDDQMKGYKM